MWLRRRTVTPKSGGLLATVGAVVEDLAAKVAAELRAEAEREREAEEQARLDAAAAHVLAGVKRWGSYFPGVD